MLPCRGSAAVWYHVEAALYGTMQRQRCMVPCRGSAALWYHEEAALLYVTM